MGRTSKAAERELQVLTLRAAGKTFDAIAQEVGYASRASAKKAYERAIGGAGTEQEADSWKVLQLHRTELMLEAVWPRARRGDLAAVREVQRLTALQIKIREGRAMGAAVLQPGDESDEASVVSHERLQELRKRRAADAGHRPSGT